MLDYSITLYFDFGLIIVFGYSNPVPEPPGPGTKGDQIQLDWKTISAIVIKFSRVDFNIKYVMSHIVVLGRTCRSHLGWT